MRILLSRERLYGNVMRCLINGYALEGERAKGPTVGTRYEALRAQAVQGVPNSEILWSRYEQVASQLVNEIMGYEFSGF